MIRRMCPELVEGHDKHASTSAVLSLSKGSAHIRRTVQPPSFDYLDPFSPGSSSRRSAAAAITSC
jgi:hypothetical protein